MRDFVNTIDDHGGVHTNSGIHNFAAFSIMTSRAQNGSFHFTAQDLAKMFYISLTQQLTRQSGFSDSRRGVLLAARSLFRALAPADLNVKVRAIERVLTRLAHRVSDARACSALDARCRTPCSVPV